MAKLSRKQIVSARKQARIAREKAIEELRDDNPDLADEQEKSLKERKDKLGFTKEARAAMHERQKNIDVVGPKITWNFDIGSLVYLPCGSVGLIVENNAVDMEATRSHDMKKTFTNSRYMGKVYVVTSTGNNWYYPKQLKLMH